MKNTKTKAEKRETKKKPRMKVSGKSIFVIKGILDKKAKEAKRQRGK